MENLFVATLIFAAAGVLLGALACIHALKEYGKAGGDVGASARTPIFSGKLRWVPFVAMLVFSVVHFLADSRGSLHAVQDWRTRSEYPS